MSLLKGSIYVDILCNPCLLYGSLHHACIRLLYNLLFNLLCLFFLSSSIAHLIGMREFLPKLVELACRSLCKYTQLFCSVCLYVKVCVCEII